MSTRLFLRFRFLLRHDGWGTATPRAVRLIAQGEIPAFAGMTWEGAGMTWEGAGMTWVSVGMTWVGVEMTESPTQPAVAWVQFMPQKETEPLAAFSLTAAPREH